MNSGRADTNVQMSAEVEAAARQPVRSARRRWRLLGWTVFLLFDLLVLAAVLMFIASHVLSGKELVLPDRVAEAVGSALSRGLDGGKADVAGVRLRVERRKWPEVVLHGVEITAAGGSELVAVPEISVSIDSAALWKGRVQPRAMLVRGASANLRRNRDGRLDLGFGAGTAEAQFSTLADAIAAFEQIFDLPALAPVERIEVVDTRLALDDLRSGRSWNVEHGTLELINAASELSASASLQLPPPADQPDAAPARVALRLTVDRTSDGAQLSALIEDVPAADVGAQGPSLSWLEPLRAKVSGALIAGLSPEGQLGAVNGTLELGAGAFQPETSATPIRFEGARAYFSYRPETGRLTFDELSMASPNLNLVAAGHADLVGIETGWPTAMVAQIQISELMLDTPGLFQKPALFDSGAIDVKISLDPFVARVGQLHLTVGGANALKDSSGATQLNASGSVSADDAGWHVALDVGLDHVGADRLVALWPLPLAPGPRKWVVNNLHGGEVFGATSAIRFDQGKRPDVGISFQFRDGEVQAMRTLPPIEGASGYASIGKDVFALTIEKGTMTPPRGGPIDASESVVLIGDTHARPATLELLLRTRSSVTAALSLLDQPPFSFLQKAGQPVDLAEGRATLEGRVTLPIRPKLAPGDVDFGFNGTLTGVSSRQIVPDRLLTAATIALTADTNGLRLAGEAQLEQVPVDAEFVLPLGGAPGLPRVAGDVRVGAALVDALGIGLPEGLVGGDGDGSFVVEIPKDAPLRFSLTSGLVGVTMSMPELGWSKPAAAAGDLRLSGRLGDQPAVESLKVSAPNLSLDGSVTISPDGGLARAQFDSVSLGGWLDAPVTLIGRGAGRAPEVLLPSGRVDLRELDLGGSGEGGDGGGGDPIPIRMTLDRLTVTDGLFLSGFNGQIATGAGGLTGTFRGSVNGKAQVTGAVAPGRRGGTGVEIRSSEAGSVFRAAGLFGRATGGSMSLDLQPRREPGEFDGSLKVKDVRVSSSDGLTALINAISLVGLIDELNGAGILFSDVEAEFRLTPRQLQVTRASGVGPSMGITMEGIYDMANDRLDMQGVFSPIYVVNSIGSIFTRKGEGLFGVNYWMRGRASNPSVEVNPLSVFTPGMFRELFRTQPPRIRGGG